MGAAEEGVESTVSSSLGLATELNGFVVGLNEEGVEGVERTISSSGGFVAGATENVESIVSTSLGFVAGLAEGGVERMISFSAGFVAPCRARLRCSLRRLMCERDDFATP